MNHQQETAARSKQEQLVALAQQAEKAKQDAEAAARRNAEGLKQGHRVSPRLGELKVGYIYAT